MQMQRCNKKLCKVKNSNCLPQWSNLPKQILLKIASLLESIDPSEKTRFQQVCKSWYISCFTVSNHVLYNNLPLQALKLPPFFTQQKEDVFFVGTCVFVVKPLNDKLTQPWLVSVEELNPGKLKIHAPLTKKPIKDLPENFPKGMNLSGFRVVLVHEGLKMCSENGCEDVVKGQQTFPWGGLSAKTKVILVANDVENLSDSESGCVAIVLVIYEGGSLMSFNLSTGGWNVLEWSRVSRFDDLVCFMGLVYVIDRKGRLYLIDVDDVARLKTSWIADGICKAVAGDNRKRLMTLGDELCMINRSRYKFEVYKLNVRSRKWEEVKSLGDKIILVSTDDVFAFDASLFPRCKGNCILFTKQCFPSYSGHCFFEKNMCHGKKYLEVGVYYLGQDCSLPISCYPELCDMLSPFPSWICSNSSSNLSSCREIVVRQSYSSELTALKSNRKVPMPPDGPIASNNLTCRELVVRKGTRSRDVSHSRALHSVSGIASVQPVNSVAQIHESGSSVMKLPAACVELQTKPLPEIIDLDLIPDVPSPDKNAKSVEKFEGVNVSSSIVSILQEVRSKHGKIIQGNVDEVQSDSPFLKCGLETLAKMVNILQSNSGKCLTYSDAKFLDASLRDLQFGRFNTKVVNWLVPLVRSALDRFDKENTERMNTVKQLEGVKSQMLEVLREITEKLEEEKKIVAQNRPHSTSSDIKKERM